MLNRWLKSSTFLTATIMSGMLLTACSNDTELGSKTLIETQRFEIPYVDTTILDALGLPTSGVLPIPIEIPIDPASVPSYDEDDLEFVTSISVREIIFEIHPDSNDAGIDANEDGNLDSFEFVSGLVLSLVATVDGELKTVQVATLPMSDPQIASNTQKLEMVVDDTINIRDLLEAPNGCILSVEISGDIPPDALSVDATIRFRAGIGIRS